jgi:hypothetical protein
MRRAASLFVSGVSVAQPSVPTSWHHFSISTAKAIKPPSVRSIVNGVFPGFRYA